jgi:hypothetical protein
MLEYQALLMEKLVSHVLYYRIVLLSDLDV